MAAGWPITISWLEANTMGAATKLTAIAIATIKTVFLLMLISFG
jgi:hypothetical protein